MKVNSLTATDSLLAESYGMDEYILRDATYYNDKPMQGLPQMCVETIAYFTYFIEHAMWI